MKRIITIGILLFFILEGFAQGPKLNDLFIPTSPGLILGDKAPLNVQRPTTPRALGLNLLNLLEGGAVEVSPYWLGDRSGDQVEDWLEKNFTLPQTFSLSVASYKDNGVYGIAPGFRTKLFRFYLDKRNTMQVVAELQNILGADTIDETAIQKKFDEYNQSSELSVDMAAAMLSTTNNNSFRQLHANKYAAWLNVSYNLPKSIPLSGTALVRYTRSLSGTRAVADTSSLDIGIGVNYTGNKFTLGGEYIYRRDMENHLDYSRFVVACNYKVSENLFIVGSFGKNFSEVNNLVAILGLNIGLSREQAQIQ